MKLHHLWKALLLFVGIGSMSACGDKSIPAGNAELSSPSQVSSPSGNISLNFFLTPEEEAAYQVFFQDKMVIDTSLLGFEFKDQPAFSNNLQINSISTDSVNESWNMPWGEQSSVTNHYKQLVVALQEQDGLERKVDLIFRVFDDGVGFRYFFPEQENMEEAVILEENTQFNLTADHQSWWIPGDWDSYEHLYHQTPVSEINALALADPGLNQSTIMENAVHTPFTMKSADDLYISIHEAAICTGL